MSVTEYPLYIRKEAARLVNVRDDLAHYNERNIINFWMGRVICDLLMNGCETMKEPVDPDLILARELYALYIFNVSTRTRVLEGVFDSDRISQRLLTFIKENNLRKVPCVE